jgi:hypothetical protein
MQHRSHLEAAIAVGIAGLIVSAFVLLGVEPANAQCGSQASSCKNCHETQAKDPVNADGNAWHESHAFGDFCYICHGGNNQSMDETAAHTGMVSPMSDIQAACGQCHPNDLRARADVYATKLGVTASLGGPAPTAMSATATPVTSAPSAGDSFTSSQPKDGGNVQLVDYVTRYNETVLHHGSTNWGNVILLVMIGAMLVGGGGLVVRHEGWVKVSIRDSRPIETEYPADVVDMAPSIAKLGPDARKALRRLLEEPEAMAGILTSIDRLAERRSPDVDRDSD